MYIICFKQMQCFKLYIYEKIKSITFSLKKYRMNRILPFIAQRITILQHNWGRDLYEPSHLKKLRRVEQCAPWRFDSTWLFHYFPGIFLLKIKGCQARITQLLFQLQSRFASHFNHNKICNPKYINQL